MVTVRKALTKSAVDVAQSLNSSLEIAGDVIIADLTSLTEVGQGNILKVVIAAQTFVAFADADTSSITAAVATSPGLDLPSGTHYILCMDKFIIMSTNPSRKELIRL